MAGLYIHIPFCTDKCFYCDFYSGNQLYLLNDYVDAVAKEIRLRYNYLDNSPIESIFFGGGTPSLLSGNHFEKIFEAIRSSCVLDDNAEITIECNPENINDSYVEDLFQVGINRISLGVQFLDDTVLSSFNRKHSKYLIYNALDIIGNSKFDNLSVDLIYSVPGISDNSLAESLMQLAKFNIRHISAYSLTISKNSVLFWKIAKGNVVECDEDCFLTQYKIIQDFCEDNGFKQYEVSNYAKEGYQSTHNLAYWKQVPYLGIGVSAHSYNLVSRQWNHTNIKKYIRDLKVNILDVNVEQLSDIELYNEYVILRLRTFQGLSCSYVESHFSKEIYEHFETNIQKLRRMGHFYLYEELIIPLKSDLLLADFLAKYLML